MPPLRGATVVVVLLRSRCVLSGPCQNRVAFDIKVEAGDDQTVGQPVSRACAQLCRHPGVSLVANPGVTICLNMGVTTCPNMGVTVWPIMGVTVWPHPGVTVWPIVGVTVWPNPGVTICPNSVAPLCPTTGARIAGGRVPACQNRPIFHPTKGGKKTAPLASGQCRFSLGRLACKL